MIPPSHSYFSSYAAPCGQFRLIHRSHFTSRERKGASAKNESVADEKGGSPAATGNEMLKTMKAATRQLMHRCAASLLLALLAGCGWKDEDPRLDDDALKALIPEGVSWASLLLEASDLTSLTVPPQPAACSRQFSSSSEPDKASLAHLAPEVFGDLDHGFFLRVEDKAGYVEATLAETIGPGAVTWIWSANPVGSAALFIDDPEKPALVIPFANLLAGSFLPHRTPFACVTAQGHNLHFPIIHTNSFRLAVRASTRKELSSLYYHVAWNSIPQTSQIHAFDIAAVQSSPLLLKALAARFSQPPPTGIVGQKREQGLRLDPGHVHTILHADHAGLIRSVEFTASDKAALAGLWIEAHWDGESPPSVRCPLYTLAGVSAAFEDTESMPATVRGRQATIRWPMPFSPGSVLSCSNGSAKASAAFVKIQIETIAEKTDASPLRFHAIHNKWATLSLAVRNVVTLGGFYGPGHIAGCTLSVDSRSPDWWGEGDEIIWLDRRDKPAWRGTGTEDYFGFAWCSGRVFNHPLRGQTRADGRLSNRRIAAMHRYHLIDRLPFQGFAKFEMEAWGLGSGFMDYETTLLGYAPVTRPWGHAPDAPGVSPPASTAR
jgi:hypothetical protein